MNSERQIDKVRQAVLPHLKKGDLKAANLLCKKRYGKSYKQASTISKVLSGQKNSTFLEELSVCLLEIIENRKALKQQIKSKI